MKKDKILNFMYIYLLLQPVLDLVTSLMTKFLDFPITLGIFVRGILFVVAIIYILFISKSKYRKISNIYLYILFCFSLLYFLTKISLLSNISFLLNEMIYMIKYYYILIMILFLFNFFDEFKPNNNKIIRILKIDLFLYCFIIIFAYFTNTSFGTYLGGTGNMGWFYSGNEISINIAILFPILYLFIDKSNSYNQLFLILFIVFGIEIIGTKTSILGLLLSSFVFLFYFLMQIKQEKKKQVFITLIILLFIIISFKGLPVIQNVKNGIYRYQNNTEIIDNVTDENDSQIVTSLLLSNRDVFQKNISKIYSSANLNNKLFGIGFSNRNEINDININKLIEMDFYDIFYHYGIIGFTIYFTPFIFLIFIAIKKVIRLRFKLNIEQLTFGYISFISLCISFLVGHTLGSPSVSTYLSLIYILFIYYLENNKYLIELDDKKITIMALHLGIGGIEKYISSICKMLENDYKIEIISTYKISNKSGFNFDDRVKIKYLINDYPHREEFKKSLKNIEIINIFKYGYSLIKILLLKYLRNIEIVEKIDSKYIITTRVFHNCIVGNYKNTNVIVIATEHNYHNNNKTYIKKVISSCNNIDYLVLVSEELKEFYEQKINKTKCIYIPNVIDNIVQYNPKKEINNKLISVGRLSKEKGFSDLIDIINIVKNKIPNIVLDVYGDGNLKNDLKQKIKTLNLSKNINLLGFKNHETILEKMNQYDLYVMTSFTESFGLVLIEAMSRSIPCVAFDSANGAKYLLNDENGLLVSNRDKEEYSKRIVELLNNIKQLNKLSKKGYNSVLKYDIDTVRKEWLNLLKNA